MNSPTNRKTALRDFKLFYSSFYIFINYFYMNFVVKLKIICGKKEVGL